MWIHHSGWKPYFSRNRGGCQSLWLDSQKVDHLKAVGPAIRKALDSGSRPWWKWLFIATILIRAVPHSAGGCSHSGLLKPGAPNTKKNVNIEILIGRKTDGQAEDGSAQPKIRGAIYLTQEARSLGPS